VKVCRIEPVCFTVADRAQKIVDGSGVAPQDQEATPLVDFGKDGGSDDRVAADALGPGAAKRLDALLERFVYGLRTSGRNRGNNGGEEDDKDGQRSSALAALIDWDALGHREGAEYCILPHGDNHQYRPVVGSRELARRIGGGLSIPRVGVEGRPVKRILFIPFDLNHLGGGSAVAAWALQALAAHHEISILTWEPADVRIANRHFGTSLNHGEFRWFTINSFLRRTMSLVPLPLGHLKRQILYREAKQLDAVEHFDVVFGAMGEIDVGVRAIQYIHYPWAHWPRPESELRWYHISPLVRAYRRISTLIAGHDTRRVVRNLTLANSDWTGRVFEECYGVRPRTVYPPVPGGFPEVPFEQRARAFTCIGRIAPEKKLEDIIRILAAVRARGHEIRLQIIGHVDSPAYMKRIAGAASDRAWVSYHHDMPREEMMRLIMRNRYAIHGMTEEHFGIAPAELQRAGCITYVPNSGGPPEIVGRDERVVYHSIDDAVEKIDRMLADPELESVLRQDVELRRLQFTEQRFMDEILEIVNSFEHDQP
jgi:glycosyltransferase involved in cell wall biosynthesis